MSAFSLRPATGTDEPILWQMLFEAAHLWEAGYTSVEAAKAQPLLARYVAGWASADEPGVIAVTSAGEPIGAAWLRLLTGAAPGYGYVDAETPELAIGVLPGYQGQGVGTALLSALLERAKQRYPAVSLSTRAGNLPAVRLYTRMGFRTVSGSEVTNLAGTFSYTMKVEFACQVACPGER